MEAESVVESGWYAHGTDHMTEDKNPLTCYLECRVLIIRYDIAGIDLTRNDAAWRYLRIAQDGKYLLLRRISLDGQCP